MIPVFILTGFLGAGKTTFLNRLLKDPALSDTAVIVNEFGETGIDHLLVEQATDGIVELSGGCLCCTVQGELAETLAGLADRLQTGRLTALARVVIETSGLADPGPVLEMLASHPVLRQAFSIGGVITIADAVHGVETLRDHDEGRAQVMLADRIIISKADLGGDISGLRTAIGKLNSRCDILLAADVHSPADLLTFGITSSHVCGPGCNHDHHHGHHHHGDAASFTLGHDGPLPVQTIDLFLDLLRSAHGEGLLRFKGLAETPDDARPLVIQGVRRMLAPHERLASWPDGQRGTRLVLIGTGMDQARISALFDAFCGKAQIGQPDRTALTDNPLAVPGFKF